VSVNGREPRDAGEAPFRSCCCGGNEIGKANLGTCQTRFGWIVAASLELLWIRLEETDSELELSDANKFNRQIEAIIRCVAMCDAYPGRWLDEVRSIAIDTFLLPADYVEEAIRHGRQQAQEAREWRAAEQQPRPSRATPVASTVTELPKDRAYRLPKDILRQMNALDDAGDTPGLKEFVWRHPPHVADAMRRYLYAKRRRGDEG
jgi:hypothetical protein